MDNLQFSSFLCAVLLSITVHFIALRLGGLLCISTRKFAIILSFCKGKILFREVWRTKVRHHAKFCRNSSIKCGIVIFRFLKMATTTILIFEFAKFYWLKGPRGARCTIVLNFIKIGQYVTKILLFFDFSRLWPSAILSGTYLDHHAESLSLCKIWL